MSVIRYFILIRIDKTMKKFIVTILLILIPLFVILISGILFFRVSHLSVIFSSVLFLATAINEHTGVNVWLARMIAVPFLILGYYCGLRYVLFERAKKLIGYVSLCIVWLAICAAMFMTQGSFSRTTGEALRHYFRDEQGLIVLREHAGTDAETGKSLQPVTPEIMTIYQAQQRGILQVTDATLFDPVTGEPLKRYYQAADGLISLFPREMQFHPEYGAKLELMTPEIAAQFARQQIPTPTPSPEPTAAPTMTPSPTAIPTATPTPAPSPTPTPTPVPTVTAVPTPTHDLVVSIMDDTQRLHGNLAQAIVSLIATQRRTATTISGESRMIMSAFDHLFAGDTDAIQQSGVMRYGTSGVFGKVTVASRENPALQNTITVTFSLDLRVVHFQTGAITHSMTVTQNGVGFSQADAETMAIDRIIQALEPKIGDIIQP
jgi:hypothetical protein